MAHFGILSFKGTGHLNPLIALSIELIARGHSVSFVQRRDLETRIRSHGIGFCLLDELTPLISEIMAVKERTAEEPEGFAEIYHGLRRISAEIEMYLRDAPKVIRCAGIDVLIVDEIAFAGPTLAEMLQLPYFIVSTSIPHRFGWDAPSVRIARRSLAERLKRLVLEVSIQRMHGPVQNALDVARRSYGLPPSRFRNQTYPELAHITPLPRCLDLPVRNLPTKFHYTGPFVAEDARSHIDFPWHRLDGRRLVYASLGTTLKGEPDTYRLIAQACAGLDLQLVITLGGRRDPALFLDLPGRPVVVKSAPQLALLKRAALVITHAGPNTAFETILCGIPMIAIPKAFDQPAIAERLRRAGVAEVLSLSDLDARQLRASLVRVLDEPRYLLAAKQLQREVTSIRGLSLAADIVEGALHRHRLHVDDVSRNRHRSAYSYDSSVTAK